MRDRLVALVALVAGCGSGQVDPSQCGNGVVDGTEQCDDANLQDGDGCSATCDFEELDTGFSCVEVFEAVEIDPAAVAASADGVVLIGGEITTEQRGAHGWVGAFDAEGALLWSLELDDGHDVWALRPRANGFIALDRGPEQFSILELDSSGKLGAQTSLPADVAPRAMLETADGLLLAGNTNPGATQDFDLWLGRQASNGTIEVLMTEDHAGWNDHIMAIEQRGDAIGVLSSVGLINRSDGDQIVSTVEGTMLIEYDLELAQTQRTLLADDDEFVSWIPNDLVGSPDGTWIIAGQQRNLDAMAAPRLAWAAGVRDGELAWSHTVESPELPGEFPHAALLAAAAGEHAVLVGALRADAGLSRLMLRLDPKSGDIVEQANVVIGDGPHPTRLSSTADGRGWFVGHSTGEDKETQWLCDVRL